MKKLIRPRWIIFVAIALSIALGLLAREWNNGPEKSLLGITKVSAIPRAGRTNMPIRSGHWVPYVCEPAFVGHTFCDPLYVTPLPGRVACPRRYSVVGM